MFGDIKFEALNVKLWGETAGDHWVGWFEAPKIARVAESLPHTRFRGWFASSNLATSSAMHKNNHHNCSESCRVLISLIFWGRYDERQWNGATILSSVDENRAQVTSSWSALRSTRLCRVEINLRGKKNSQKHYEKRSRKADMSLQSKANTSLLNYSLQLRI